MKYSKVLVSQPYYSDRRSAMRRRIGLFMTAISAIVMLSSSLGVQQIYAISQGDLNSINNNTPFYDPDAVTTDCSTSTTSNGAPNLVGSDPEQEAYNYFVGQGLNAIQASAVVGNFVDESHFDPEIMERGGDSKNPADAGTTPQEDGWGIAQWSPGEKIIGIAASLNVTSPIYLLSTQLEIIWDEMTGTSPTGFSDLVATLKKDTTLTQAVDDFQVDFEGGISGTRLSDAQAVYNTYGNSSTGGGSSDGAGTSSTGGCGGTTASVDCSSSTGATAALSQTRQSVVCIAEQELALWKSKPGYPNPAYAGVGLLKYTGGTCTGDTCTGGIYEEWCADFVSWAYDQAKDPIAPDPGWMLAAVDEIQAVGQEGQSFHWHPESSGYVPRPGDIAIHGGFHTNIYISSSGSTTTYIGGDQGSGPYGADPPTTTPPDPPSGSNVSIETGTGYYDNGITGYVSPD